MYTVKVYHHCKAWRNGDLEDDFQLKENRQFSTRKAAKDYIMSCVRGKKIQEYWHKGDERSYVLYFTGETWQHENSGERMEEYYQYILEKTKVYR